MKKTPKILLTIVTIFGVTFCAAVRFALAEEGGSSHYFPGSMASFIDGVSPTPVFILRYNQIYYNGSAAANKAIPVAGHTTLGLHATSWGEGITLVWRPKMPMPKHWSYQMSGTVPFLQMDVSAKAVVNTPGAGSIPIALEGTLGALGDVVIQPVMLNYNISPSLNMNFRVSFYLPTGDFSTGRLANTGKNYTTTEPTIAIMYMGPKNGREASLYAGFDFNTINSTTQYQTGTQFHLDGTLAQHLPLWKGMAGIGVASFYYQQITGDSGSGANFGELKGTTAGIGPVVSYVKPIGKQQLLAELKFLPEYYTANRLQGNIGFLKIMYKF